ncbi:hypothetical protein MNAN1_000942 [Malassezia nana]|uniref:Alpha/beta hydrolase family protein n=1 Tax=Malassezia nana TaxID=180528 RepID=A0AAF0EI32_9BASI|nr:hypothetical protein MNAN1_000942 [Malassezia nana]
MLKQLWKKAEHAANQVEDRGSQGKGKGGNGRKGSKKGNSGKGSSGSAAAPAAAPAAAAAPQQSTAPPNPNAYITPQGFSAPGLSAPMYAQAGKMTNQSVPEPSCTTVDVAGLPVHVYGLEQLTPARQGGPPEVCIAFHMHGRTGSAKKEDSLVRELYRNTMMERAALVGSPRVRDFLLVTFDQRNHGDRKTNPRGQKSWKEGNPTHGIDMYGMIHGTSTDVSFLLKMLPAYLFPNDERIVSLFAVTGKSLGGHAAWQVLAHEPIIRVGVPFIGTPDFQKLLAQRTKASDLPDAPPQVPMSLRSVIQRIDPAQAPYNRPDPSNPFFGKKICSCSGEDDHLVRWSFSEEFLKSLVVAPPGSEDANRSLEIFLQPNTGHKVTPEMLRFGGRWLAQWALAY